MITIRPAPVRGREGRPGIRHGFPAMLLSLVAATSAWGQGPWITRRPVTIRHAQ